MALCTTTGSLDVFIRESITLPNGNEEIATNNIKIGIVGFGYIGTCIGAVLADKNFKVVGIDTNVNIVNDALVNANKTLSYTKADLIYA